MSHSHAADLPRPLLWAAAALVVGSILLAALGRNSDLGRTTLTPAAIVAAYDLRLLSQADGSIAAYLTDGTLLETLPQERAGFVLGVIRGFARGRSLADVPADVPYSLIRYADGRLVLEDSATKERIELDVFGPTNAETFVRLWRAGEAHSLAARSDATAHADSGS